MYDSQMVIAIPTRGRTTEQTTLRRLPDSWRGRTFLFAPAEERGSLTPLFGGAILVEQPSVTMRIAEKRAWILRTLHDMGKERVLMLDDDLFFYTRREDQPDRLRDAEAADIDHWFRQLEQRLSPELPHAGFGPRQGNHNFPVGWHVGRMMLALGYHIPTVLANAHLDRIQTREDMDVCLQLLRRGYPNAVCHEFAVGQRSYAAPGGCTGERTIESSDRDAERLAELHPGLVRVADRQYRGTPRREVVVQWRRALEQGIRSRSAESGAQRSTTAAVG